MILINRVLSFWPSLEYKNNSPRSRTLLFCLISHLPLNSPIVYVYTRSQGENEFMVTRLKFDINNKYKWICF